MNARVVSICAFVVVLGILIAHSLRQSEEQGRVDIADSLDPISGETAARSEEPPFNQSNSIGDRAAGASEADSEGEEATGSLQGIAQQDRRQSAQERSLETTSLEAAASVPALPALSGFEVPERPIFLEAARELAEQTEDPSWSTEAESRILAEVSQIAGLRAILVDVECRATMCGVVVAYPDRDVLETTDVLSNLETVGDELGMRRRITLTNTAPSGAFFTAIYFVREGASKTQSNDEVSSAA